MSCFICNYLSPYFAVKCNSEKACNNLNYQKILISLKQILTALQAFQN